MAGQAEGEDEGAVERSEAVGRVGDVDAERRADRASVPAKSPTSTAARTASAANSKTTTLTSRGGPHSRQRGRSIVGVATSGGLTL
ncbi:MAG: hypothetical protein ACJ76Q_10325 [Solirubrobacteraceae bacterium]